MNLVRALKNTKSRKNPVKQFFCLLLKKVLNSYQFCCIAWIDFCCLDIGVRCYSGTGQTGRNQHYTGRLAGNGGINRRGIFSRGCNTAAFHCRLSASCTHFSCPSPVGFRKASCTTSQLPRPVTGAALTALDICEFRILLAYIRASCV